MTFDVLIVGAGPAGLSAAIRMKQLASEQNKDLSVCIVEKGEEVGSHILSGNVFEPRALNELFPNWKELDTPITPGSAVEEDHFLFLTEKSHFNIPEMLLPPQLHNNGNYVISLSQLTRWLASKAEELGVEIYPGFAAAEVLYNADTKSVCGVATSDMGIAKDGSLKDSYTRGMELQAKQTIFAEGCRGSCSEEVMARFNLRAGKDVQSYGLGIKEVWELPHEQFLKGYVSHSLGWPLQSSLLSNDCFGGCFLYYMEPNLVLLGMVVGLDYHNPHLNPYKEFQRWKLHPAIARHLSKGKCISYGARALNEGGYHAIPKLTFPGGALVGCSAGLLNSVKIKGTHTAMKSGMLLAEALVQELLQGGELAPGAEIKSYETALQSSWIADELKVVRNTHAAFHYGLLAGMTHTAFSCFISKGREPWTLVNKVSDAARTKKASECPVIEYPKPDGKLSFDLLTNLQRSGTQHDHDQPSHLVVKPELASVPSSVSIKEYAGPEQRFCPAGVYEYTEADAAGNRSLIINAQNCLHCKTCSIKCPHEYIKWTVPEGGGGPKYTIM